MSVVLGLRWCPALDDNDQKLQVVGDKNFVLFRSYTQISELIFRVEIAHYASSFLGETAHFLCVHFGLRLRHRRQAAQYLPLLIAYDIAFNSRLDLDAFERFFDFRHVPLHSFTCSSRTS